MSLLLRMCWNSLGCFSSHNMVWHLCEYVWGGGRVGLKSALHQQCRVRLWGRSSCLLVAQLCSACCFNWIILKSAISVSFLFPKLSYQPCSLTTTQLPNFTPEMALSQSQAKRRSLRSFWGDQLTEVASRRANLCA